MTAPTTCRHTDHIPVDVLVDGRVETVARLCLDCSAQLHPGFGCEACEWDELTTRTFGDQYVRIDHFLIAPCKEHANA